MNRIDLDHNATTPMADDVIERVAEVMRDAAGNPGSRHAAGRKARQVLEESRERVAEQLGARGSEVVFTSGGTESINTAILGLARGSDAVVALPPGEHPATERTVDRLTTRGWKELRLPIDTTGRLLNDRLHQFDWSNVRLATALLAHNETGVLQDLSPLVELCRQHRVPLHVDGVQAVGKVPVHFHQLGATALSAGGHKFNGPRGIGLLLIRDGVRLSPLLSGGHQETGRRAGTEPIALIAGLTLALEQAVGQLEWRANHMRTLRDRLQSGLLQLDPTAVVHGDQTHRLPNTLCISFPGRDGDSLLVALDLAGVCCSMGSACSSGSSEPAPILVAMGVPPEQYRSALRFSVGPSNTEAEIDTALQRIQRILHRKGQS
ncbi:MAG: cysteine desulfurase family protein [Planctomycetaceae bacterium]